MFGGSQGRHRLMDILKRDAPVIIAHVPHWVDCPSEKMMTWLLELLRLLSRAWQPWRWVCLILFVSKGLSTLTKLFPPRFLTVSRNVDFPAPMSLACMRNDLNGAASTAFLTALGWSFFFLPLPGFLSMSSLALTL